MDVESIYLITGVVALFSTFLLIIKSLFRNKSYEEVLAEQKQQTNALYGSQLRPKLKDKKQKKANKKIKEKKLSTAKESDDSQEPGTKQSDAEESPKESPKAAHVEFKEENVHEEIPSEPIKRKPSLNSKNALKPILVNKEVPQETANVVPNTPVTNHFEESHPKDDFELLNSHMVEEMNKKKHKSEMDTAKSKKTIKHHFNEEISKNAIETEIEELDATTAAPVQNAAPVLSTKDKKKKKSELNVITKSADDKQGLSLADLMPLVRKAEMSRVEVQILIDMLLNKQQDAPVVDDWSEGKGDPVQKLKKQLADREKQIIELQDSLTASQNKLRVVRTEQSGERSQLIQKIREQEEALIMNKMNREREIQGNTLKFEQIQEQFKEENHKLLKLMEENTTLKMQQQQLEMHLAQTQEANITIGKLTEDLQALNKCRNMDVAQLHQLQLQLASQKEEIDNKDSIIRELQERSLKFDNSMQHMRYQEDELKKENAAVKSENLELVQKLRHYDVQKMQEIQFIKNQQGDELDKLHVEIKKIRAEFKKLEEESIMTRAEYSTLKDENINLNKLIANLNDEKAKLINEKKSLVEAKTNGSTDMHKQHAVEIARLMDELKSSKLLLQQEKNTYNTELMKSADQISLLQKEIEAQKNKNNELRLKNWKVMEAYQAAENRFKNVPRNSNTNATTTNFEERKLELEKSKLFLEKLFPDLKLPDLQQEKWEDQITDSVNKYIQATCKLEPEETEDVTKLRSQIIDYKTIIDETEGMLSHLQKHIEREEISWREKLQLKDDIIGKLMKHQQVDYNDIATNGDVLN